MFPYLVIGVAQWLQKGENGQSYPYPSLLQAVINLLALKMGAKFPRTLSGLLEIFSHPVQEWWPEEIPAQFFSTEPLIEDGALSYEAVSYLDNLTEADNIHYNASLAQIELVVDNLKFRALFERLRQNFVADPVVTQEEYVKLRRFLIENPYPNITEISQTFSETKYISFADVSGLYVKANELASLMQFPDENKKPYFWLCPSCGPLIVRNGQLESVKPQMCSFYCPGQKEGWRKIVPGRKRMVLRRGIHLRTHLPGIPELDLFDWLLSQQQKSPQFLQGVVLWPRIDMYDIQIKFVDSTWAIDVKNYRNPYRLGEQIKTLYGEGELQWDRGFYVYPGYRERQQVNYGEVARQQVAGSVSGIEIVSDDYLKGLVTEKIRMLEEGGRHV